jgi:hypothetical protein
MRHYYLFASGEYINRLHSHEHPFDALYSGGGSMLHFLGIENGVQKVYEKLDVSETLREFARWCALQVIDIWDPPATVCDYLKTGNMKLQKETMEAAKQLEELDTGWSLESTMQAVLWAAESQSPPIGEITILHTVATAARWADRAAAAVGDYGERDRQRTKLKEMIDNTLMEAGIL